MWYTEVMVPHDLLHGEVTDVGCGTWMLWYLHDLLQGREMGGFMDERDEGRHSSLLEVWKRVVGRVVG